MLTRNISAARRKGITLKPLLWLLILVVWWVIGFPEYSGTP